MTASKLRSLALAAAAAFITSAATTAAAAPTETNLRWTFHDDSNASLDHVLEKISAATGTRVGSADFRLGEDRDLAFNHYRRYDQFREGVRVDGASIRIWTKLDDANALIQLEARVSTETATVASRALAKRATSESSAWAATLASAALAKTEDHVLKAAPTSELLWSKGALQRVFTAKAKRGTHVIRVDLGQRRIVAQSYAPYPQGDRDHEYSVPARVFPIYEEYAGKILPRTHVRLEHLLPYIPAPAAEDTFAALRERRYLYSLNDPVLGETPEGQAAGYWTLAWLLRQADELRDGRPRYDNRFASGQALLQGRYATINIHPDAFTAFPGVTLPKRYGTQLMFNWLPAENDDWEIVPSAALVGKTMPDRNGAIHRDATRHPTHDPAAYINAGFDEVQVYYGVNQLFSALRPMGFTDPDLADRAFHAFLFVPDIESQNNAFYDADTINFTTYTPDAPNMARDNTTIWHELGHGVMDRLMGTRLALADTGGLSEGMADFVAELVLRATYGEADFPGKNDQRILNNTGFFLTNEVHDDGEAYGGVMKAILDLAVERHGRAGLVMVTDLVLEAMRLSRDHPALTAEAWFAHLEFADELAHAGLRPAGQLGGLVRTALAARNFAPADQRSDFSLKYQGMEIVAGEPGSRGNGYLLELRAGDESRHDLTVALTDGQAVQFKYPVTVQVFYNSGPLQGAIDWIGEDQEPSLYTIAAPGETSTVPLTVKGTCDAINRSDGTCSDFAYVQIFNAGETKPFAKKRFYLRVKTVE